MSFTSVLKTIFGDKSTRDLKAIRPLLNKVNALRPEMEKLSTVSYTHLTLPTIGG